MDDPDIYQIADVTADAAYSVLSDILAGRPTFSVSADGSTSEPAKVAYDRAFRSAQRFGFTLDDCRLTGRNAERLVAVNIMTMKNRMAEEGVRPVGVIREGFSVGFRYALADKVRKGPVPQNIKQEMAEMARTGLTVSDIAVQYGYSEPDVRRILKSAKVVAAEVPELAPSQPALPAPPPPPPAPIVLPPKAKVVELGITGIDAEKELEVAEALLQNVPPADIARLMDVTLEAIEAVRKAWADASPTEAAAEVITFQRERKAERAAKARIDPTTEGEILFCKGASPDGWRIEIAPALAARVQSGIEELRFQTYKGSSTTEYDIIYSNIQRFSDRNLPASGKRFKLIVFDNVRVSEFKGFLARVFAGTMRSVYPNGQEVWRCGLLSVFVKKQNVTDRSVLEEAVRNMAVWRAWRKEQDEKISKRMEKLK